MNDAAWRGVFRLKEGTDFSPPPGATPAIVRAALAKRRIGLQSGRCAATSSIQHGRVYPTPRSPEFRYQSAIAIPTRIPDGEYRTSCRPSGGFGMERTARVAGVEQILRLASGFLGDDLGNTIVQKSESLDGRIIAVLYDTAHSTPRVLEEEIPHRAAATGRRQIAKMEKRSSPRFIHTQPPD